MLDDDWDWEFELIPNGSMIHCTSSHSPVLPQASSAVTGCIG